MIRAKSKEQKGKVWWPRRNVGASKPFTFYFLSFTFARRRDGFTPPPESHRRKAAVGGFTMVEVVVMLAMLTLVGGIVLASFPRLSQRIHLQRVNQQAALGLRRAQNMAFAVRQVDTAAGRVIPPAYGVYFNRNAPNSYLVFADLRGQSGTNDGIYQAATDVVVETVTLDPGVRIGQLISDVGGGNQLQDVINISFSVPEARMSIANASGLVGESAEIFFTGALNATKSVLVRTSGQIRAQ